MAQQRIQKPKFDSSSERRDGYDDTPNSLVPGNNEQQQRTSAVSQNAANTIGNIDDVLNDDQSVDSSNESGQESSFYSGSEAANENSSPSKESNTPNPGQLGAAEAAADRGPRGDAAGSLYNPTAALGGNWLARMSGRRKGVFGTLLFLVLGGGFFGGSFLSGPAQAIHYGQMLANISPFQHQEESSESRLSRMVRAVRAGNAGEMRLGYLGSKMNAHIQAQFKEKGITLKSNGLTGRFTGLEVDVSKQPKYASLDEKEVAKQFATDNGLKENAVKYNPETRILSADITRAPLQTKTGILRSYIADRNLGKVGTFSNMRVVRKALGLPNKWLSPLDSLKYSGDEKVANLADRLAANSERLKALQEKSAKVKSFNAELRGKINPSAATAVAGIAVGTLLVCSAKDIAESIPEANRLNVVYPAVASAADAIATSANMMYDIGTGDTAGLLQKMETINESGKAKDGSSATSGQSIQAIQGKDISGEAPQDATINQAFQPTQGANELNQTLKDAGSDALCSPISQIAQGVVGVGLLLIGPGGVITKLAETATTLVTMKAISAGTEAIKKIVTDDPVLPPPHQGAAGGNVDGLGSIELANITARANGGVDLDAGELSQLDARGLNQDFIAQSFAKRLFNPLDSRSLVAHTIDAQNLSASQNVASIASFAFNGIPTLGSTFTGLASLLSPKAKAAPATPYGLGVREAGMSADIIENDQDPFDSADEVGKTILDPELDGTTADGDYAKKAMICFGATFTKTDQGWDVATTADVNPYANDYQQAKCGDKSDAKWLQLRSFIHDNGVMNGYACNELDDAQACADLGFSTGSDDSSDTSTGGSTTGTPVTPSGSAADIAKKIIDQYNAGNISFEHPADLNDLQLTADGKGISNQYTCEPTVTLDPYLLQTMLDLIPKYKMRISAIVSGHGECDGYRLHGLGRAFDVGAVTELATGESSELDAYAHNSVDLDFINAAAALLPKGGHVGQTNQPGRKDATLPPGVLPLNDIPNHQHIDVGAPPGN